MQPRLRGSYLLLLTGFKQKNLQDEPYFLNALYADNINAWNVTTVMALYRLSGKFFRKANQLHAYSLQLRKLLYTLKDHIQLKFLGKEEAPKFGIEPGEMMKRCEAIAMEVARASSWNNDISDRPQILKYRDVMNIPLQARKTRLTEILNNTAGMYPVRESVLLVEGIRLKLDPQRASRPNLNFTSNYGALSNIFIRMHELRYLSDYYYQVLRGGVEVVKEQISRTSGKNWEAFFKELFELRMLYDKEKKPKSYYDAAKRESIRQNLLHGVGCCSRRIFPGIAENDTKAEELLSFLITESIACKQEVVKILNIYSPGYIASYNLLASAHNKMGRWCRLLENLYFLEEGIDKSDRYYPEIYKAIGERIGSHNMIYLDSNHHFELALQYYHRAIQMHTEGRTYRIEVRKHFFLEDDFNDQIKHFSAAMERYQMNTGTIRKQIEQIRQISQQDSILYDYNYYFSQ